MQKIINVLSITSFAVSISIIGGGLYVYANKDALIDSVKQKIMSEVSGIAGDAVKDMISTSPSLPETTGPVVPSVGLGIPQF
tara:strand:- start:121 stop:366 length:246 start_codon:yes stop_codon:yes gene_type:complete